MNNFKEIKYGGYTYRVNFIEKRVWIKSGNNSEWGFISTMQPEYNILLELAKGK